MAVTSSVFRNSRGFEVFKLEKIFYSRFVPIRFSRFVYFFSLKMNYFFLVSLYIDLAKILNKKSNDIVNVNKIRLGIRMFPLVLVPDPAIIMFNL